jgi:hypothetical protein
MTTPDDGRAFCMPTYTGEFPTGFTFDGRTGDVNNILSKPANPIVPGNDTVEADTSANAINARVASLIPNLDAGSTMTNVTSNNDAIYGKTAEFVANLNTLNTRIRSEYCYYFARYHAAVTSFLNSLRGRRESDANSKLNTVKILNSRLTFLTKFTNQIATRNTTNSQNYTTAVNSLNSQMNENQIKLAAQRELFEKENVSVETNRRMVEYTQEKNRANNNLLAMYGVLNAVALAMLVYVART